MVDFFRAIGITSADVGLKVNSRRVLSAILTKFGIAPDQVATTTPSPSPLNPRPYPHAHPNPNSHPTP